jgi:hypothetical protein
MNKMRVIFSSSIFFKEFNMKDGVGIFCWKISVALYLIANGVLGLPQKTTWSNIWTSGDFRIIFGRMGFTGDTLSLFVTITSVVALVAGVAIILEMLNVKVSFLETLILIVAIVWAVYIIIEVISWVKDGFKNFWHSLQMLAVHLMVFANLLIASKKG